MKKIELTIEEAEFCLDALRVIMRIADDVSLVCKLFPQIGRQLPSVEIGSTPKIADRLVYLIQKAKNEKEIENDSKSN